MGVEGKEYNATTTKRRRVSTKKEEKESPKTQKKSKKESMKPPEIKTRNSGSSTPDESKSKSAHDQIPSYNRKKTEELIAYKETITQKTKKRNARHARNETPQYDIYTKDLLKEEYDKAFSGDEVAVADGVLSEDDTVDDKPPRPTKKVT